MLIFYCHHFQLSSLCNWPSSGVCQVYNILSLGVKGTPSVLWSSANFCSFSQNVHYKAPVASQHWKTNKVVWTWKDDWPPWKTSTYKRPFTQEGNYLVTTVFYSSLIKIWTFVCVTFPFYLLCANLCISQVLIVSHLMFSMFNISMSGIPDRAKPFPRTKKNLSVSWLVFRSDLYFGHSQLGNAYIIVCSASRTRIYCLVHCPAITACGSLFSMWGYCLPWLAIVISWFLPYLCFLYALSAHLLS